MPTIKSALLLAIFCLSSLIATSCDAQVTVLIKSEKDDSTKKPFRGRRAAVDVAILLDTSNSMDGLISQAKNQLWTIVQEFASAERDGQTPLLRVALFEYGNSRLPASEGYVRQVVQLTDDLDELSEALFALKTKGGDEYCGQVIDEALTRLDWTDESNSYKAVFIAGNEPFTQGSVDYKDSCRRAIESGVIVNTIHCGNYQQGIQGKWKHGADMAEGEYFNIDQDEKEIHIDCPQDTVILKLNAELNKTYLWFGAEPQRQKWGMRQEAQDSNAASEAPATAVGRAVAKAGKAYSNVQRDLVDGLEADDELLSRVSEGALPDGMKDMDESQRVAYVKKMSAKRKALQEQIAGLNVERGKFVAKKRAELAGSDQASTLGEVMVGTLRKQLAEAGFEVEKK